MSDTGNRTDFGPPDVITRYMHAHDKGDVVGAVNAFASGAALIDHGHVYLGSNAIHEWLTSAVSRYDHRTFVRWRPTGEHTHEVVNRLTGSFPGNAIELRYRFVFADGLIQSLVIAP